MAHNLFRDSGGLNARIQVDARRDAHVFEHVDQLLGRDVTARTGSERAAAETTGGCVQISNTVLHSRQRAGNASATRVVEVHTQAEVTHSFADSVDQSSDTSGRCSTDGICDRELISAELFGLLRNP